MLEDLVWLVPGIVIVAGVWRPRAGLLVFAAALPLFGAPPGGPYLAALDVAAIAAIATGAAPADAFRLPEEAEIAVVASLAEGAKCQRCWRVLAEVGAVAAAPDLCARCAEAVAPDRAAASA